MKKLLFIAVFLISTACFGQNKVINRTQWNLDRYVNKYLKELKIDSCTIVLQQSDGLIYGRYPGLTLKNADGFYTVAVYNYATYNEACLIVAHELAHVRQFIDGYLVVTDNIIFYKGKNETSKYNLAHEDEAREEGLRLYYKFHTH